MAQRVGCLMGVASCVCFFAAGCSPNPTAPDAATDVVRTDILSTSDEGTHAPSDATIDAAHTDARIGLDTSSDAAACLAPDAPYPLPPGVTAPTGSPAVSAYLDVLAQLHRVACEREARCCFERSPARCLETPGRFMFEPAPGRLAVQLARIAHGELTFDRAALAPCLEMLARTCPGSFSLGDAATPACSSLLHGTLAEGSTCLGSEDCATGLRCRPIEVEAGQACVGTCVPVRAGDLCRGNVCGTLFCNARAGESVGRCVDIPLVAVADSARDNGCDVLPLSSGTELRTCPAGTVCRYTGLETIFTCRPACTVDCSAESTVGGLDSPCLYLSQCDTRRGLVCDPLSSRCAPPGACHRDDDCAVDQRCDGSACVRRAGARPAGADCTRHDECVSNRCERGVCTSLGCWS